MNYDSPRYKLWKFFCAEHNLHLLDTEMNDIIREVERLREEEKKEDTDAELGNIIQPQPCPVEDCINEINGECGENDETKYDHCMRRRKAIEEEENR